MLRWGGVVAIALMLAGGLSLDAFSDERCHAYDTQGRLKSSSRSTGKQESWTYDRADNRKTRTQSDPGGSCGSPTGFASLVGSGIAGLIALNPSRTVTPPNGSLFTLAHLANTQGNAAEIESFSPTFGCGSRTIAANGQSVTYTPPSNIQLYNPTCPFPPTPDPPLSCPTSYVIRNTANGLTLAGVANIAVNPQLLPMNPPPATCDFN